MFDEHSLFVDHKINKIQQLLLSPGLPKCSRHARRSEKGENANRWIDYYGCRFEWRRRATDNREITPVSFSTVTCRVVARPCHANSLDLLMILVPTRCVCLLYRAMVALDVKKLVMSLLISDCGSLHANFS
jgi:hypothetical protein